MAESGGLIDTSHLSEKIHTQSVLPYTMTGKETLNEMVESLEKAALSEAIKTHGGNKTRIAEALGLSRNGLMKKLKRYSL